MQVNKHTIKHFSEKLAELLIKKNHDYGNSVQEQFEKYGLTAYLIRDDDKTRRLETLAVKEAQVSNESLKDTVLDKAGYALLHYILMHEEIELEAKEPIRKGLFIDKQV